MTSSVEISVENRNVGERGIIKEGPGQGPGLDLEAEVEHSGGCHCGKVRWKVVAPAVLDVFDCNCSICFKKALFHFIVPKDKFTLLQGQQHLTNYSFNTKVAKHPFCNVCGAESFYSPRSNPTGWGIMYRCVDSPTIKKVIFHPVDGQNWEQAVPGNALLASKTPQT